MNFWFASLSRLKMDAAERKKTISLTKLVLIAPYGIRLREGRHRKGDEQT